MPSNNNDIDSMPSPMAVGSGQLPRSFLRKSRALFPLSRMRFYEARLALYIRITFALSIFIAPAVITFERRANNIKQFSRLVTRARNRKGERSRAGRRKARHNWEFMDQAVYIIIQL